MTITDVMLALPTVKVGAARVEKVNMGGYMTAWSPQVNEAVAEFDSMPAAIQRTVYRQILAQFAAYRERFGLGGGLVPLSVLSNPESAKQENLKIGKNDMATWSLTLQSAGACKVLEGDTFIVLNTCRWSGLCGPLCVLSHGRGMFSTVQAARNWRTWILWQHPIEFALALRFELLRASARGPFLARWNVNSDLPWHHWESLFGGVDMKAYDYTKDPAVLEGDGKILSNYRRIYSWSEKSDATAVGQFLAQGGSVAMVTNRHKGQACVATTTVGGVVADVVDGDVDDDRWSTADGVVVDLYAKGKARNRATRFVVNLY